MERTIALLARLAIAFCVACSLPADIHQARATLSMDQLGDQHRRVLDRLNTKTSKDKVPDLDDPRMPGLLKEGWNLAGAWAAAYFNNHRQPSTHELEHLFDGFAPPPREVKSEYGDFFEYPEYNFKGGAIRIAAEVYVVQASYFKDSSTGAFILVARNCDGHFQALWNVKDEAEKHYAQGDEIGRWLFLVRRAYYNGPLDVNKILPVPPAATGHARFLVDAYQSADGGTHTSQLSIWEWNGSEAKPLLIGLYNHTDSSDLRFEGRTVRVTTKEDLATMSSCGMCDTPRGFWTIRITPHGVQDLGHRFLQPELQWADRLFSQIQKGGDTSKLADPRVVAALPDQSSWRMLDQCRVLSRGRQGAFELGLDDVRLRLSYVLRNGKPYFTKAIVR